MTEVHAVPVDDLIEHEIDDIHCACGPDKEIIIAADGRTGTLVTHHSLDGRELGEPDNQPNS